MTMIHQLNRLTDARCFLIAYSGGLDSHVLLHKMALLRSQHPELQLRAVHVHHGLNQQADAWAVHCKSICDALEIPFLLLKVTISREAGESLEALARHKRYHAISACLAAEECLLTAHTQDDQAETLLLQLLRGAGPKGLAAMPMKKPFAHSLLLRPLLNQTRASLQAYAEENQLHWVEDDSNQDTGFDRNYLRHRVMPLLKERWPAALNNLTRSASHCADAAHLLETFASQDLLSLQGTVENTLSVSALLSLSEERRCNALRHWFRTRGYRVPSTKQLQQLEQDVLRCDQKATPVMHCQKAQLRRYRDDLYLISEQASFDASVILPWDLQSPLLLPGDLGTLTPEQCSLPPLELDRVTLRFRQGGERIKPAGSAHTQSLKKLFQSWGVPPWQRDRIPLIYSGDRLVAVVGYCCKERV